MNSPLFRKLLVTAILLLVVTVFLVNYTMTSFAESIGASVQEVVRYRVLLITIAASLLALVVAAVVSHSLSNRVTQLKRLADGMLRSGLTSHDTRGDDDLGSLERSLSGVGGELTALVDNLRFESARREAILSGMTEGVMAVDRETRVTFCNQAFLRAIGYPGDNYEGLSLVEMVRDPALHQLIRQTLSVGQPATLRFQLSADTPRTFEVQATPFAMASGRGAIAIFHDVTDLERLEQVRKDFVANVSHELRTPLAGIIGYADTLLDGALEDAPNRRRFVEIIRSNAVRLGSIAADLLSLSELESAADADAEPISLRGVLESVLQTVDAEANARDVRLVRGDLEDLQVMGSRLRMEQALLNLVANAIKFNKPGGEVRVSIMQKLPDRAAIVVADSGVGIPSQDVPRIFERFYRVDRARSRQVGGTGLGLSIVKHAVERMNGSVSVESQLGKGTTFTIVVPLARNVMM